MASRQRVGQRRTVDHLQFAANRHAVGDTTGFDAGLRAQLGNIVRGSLSFNRRVGREDQLTDFF